jgi:hypothetical protein
VPRSLAAEMDADPATEQAFDALMNDDSAPQRPARDKGRPSLAERLANFLDDESKQDAQPPGEHPPPAEDAEEPTRPVERPSLVAGLADLDEAPPVTDAAPLSLTAEPPRRETDTKSVIDELSRSSRMRLADLEAAKQEPSRPRMADLEATTTAKPRTEPEAKPRMADLEATTTTVKPRTEPEAKPRLADLEATTTPMRARPQPEPEPTEEFDEVEEAEEVEELDEAPTTTRPSKPAPPPLKPAKAPPPPPRDVFKPRPLLPIVPPKKK